MPSFEYLIHHYGLIVVAGVIGFESLGLPFPGETVLMLAGAYAGSKHGLNIVEVILTAAASATVGQAVGYVIGRGFGYWLLLRYGGYVGITESRIKLGQYLFLRHGGKIIIAGRFVPLLRSLAGILAGANRMPWRQFMLANAFGSLLWAMIFGVAAYMLGRQVERLASSALIVVGLGALLVLLAFAMFARRHEAQLAAEAERALPGPLRAP